MKKGIIIVAVALVIVALLAVASIRIIQPSTVGIVVTMGSYEKQIGSGMHFVIPLVTQVYEYDLRIQQYTEKLQAYSKDTQTVDYELSVQYVLDNSKVAEIYLSMGSEYQTRIAPLIAESSKSIFSMYTADQIVSKRNELSGEMLLKTKEMLAPYNITVTEVALSNIDFSDEYEAAIERKQIASQDVLTERHMLEKVQIQGEQSIAKAKADAEVQRLKEETLTDKILQQQALEKWDGKLPYYFGGGELPFITITDANTDTNANKTPEE